MAQTARGWPTRSLRPSGPDLPDGSDSRSAVELLEEIELQLHGAVEVLTSDLGTGRADRIELVPQEVHERAEIRIVVQRDPLRVHEAVGKRAGRGSGPVEIEPFGHQQHREDQIGRASCREGVWVVVDEA